MTTTATLSAKFQISIPKAVRDEQDWQAGREFGFIPKGKGVLLMPVPALDQLAGIARGAAKDSWRDRQDRCRWPLRRAWSTPRRGSSG